MTTIARQIASLLGDHSIVEEMVFIEGADTLTIPTEVENNTLCLSCHALRDDFKDISREMVAEYEANRDSIAAVVIGGTSLSGGKGSVLGTVLGALIIGVLNTGLTSVGVDPFWQKVI